MNTLYCLLTYVLLSFLIYTSLDRTFVESLPIIPDGSRNDPNNGLASDADIMKKLLNSVGANEEVNIDNGNNDGNENQGHVSEERREEENGETYEGHQDSEDGQDANAGGLNEDMKEGDDQGRDYVRLDEHSEQKQAEADGYNQQSAREDDKDKILSENSAQKEELLPVDPQEGQGDENVRNPEMTKVDNSDQQSAVHDEQNPDNSVQSQDKKSSQFDGTDVSETIRRLGLFVNPPVQGSDGADSRPTESAYVPKVGVGGDGGQGQPDQSQQATFKPNQPPSGNSYSSTAVGNPSMSLVPANNNPDAAKGTTTKFAFPVTLTPSPRNMQVSVTQSQGLPAANVNSGGQNGQQSESGSQQPNTQDNQSSQQHQNSVPYSQESRNTDMSIDPSLPVSKQKGVDVPDEFQAGDTGVDTDEDTQSENHYSEDGYLEPPSNNLDNDRVIADKTDEDTNRNNNYDDSSDPNANLNNKNIIDDNNENVIYNGDNNQDSVYDGDEKKDSDENYDDTNDDDDDDFSYQEKINNIDSNESKTLDPSDKDDWYDDTGDDTGEDGNNKDKDFEHTDIDEEAEFRYTHVKHPEYKDDGSLYFSNIDPKVQEGLVEYKLVNNRTSLNAPSSMVLFYTWIILIVLVAVVTFSAFRYRCKGIIMNGSRNYRNGNHSNYRNGEENKNLLDNVYT